jgi:predicted nucleic acid-binding protein
VKFLIDTNIWLEELLNQVQSEEVRYFLDSVPVNLLFISDFTLHSIGVIMGRFKKYDEYKIFINDLFIDGEIKLLGLTAIETKDVFNLIRSNNLDFDDSYQYIISKKYNLHIVTFDNDFKKSGIKTFLPKDAVKLL